MSPNKPDLVVVGGGAAGLAAAFAARWQNLDVTLVNDGPIGGDCTFTGCVPSKALLAASARGREFGDAMKDVADAVQTIAAAESADHLRTRGISVIEGRARLLGGGRVDVDGTVIDAPKLILAAGSRPARPPIEGLASTPHLTNEELFELDHLPSRLAIIGGGPIGCEMAQAFAGFGSTVVLIEAASGLLPRDEPRAGEVIHAALTRAGVDVRVGQAVQRVEASDQAVVVTVDGESVTVDELLVATGRSPALDDLGLDAAGVEVDERGWIKVDDHLATTGPGVYAAGDVVGSIQLTHAAAAMARIAVMNAVKAGPARLRPMSWHPEEIGWVTFTTPEVGQVGLTAAQAANVRGARLAEMDLSEIDRAVATGRAEGFVQLIAAPRRGLRSLGGGRLIGATVVADRAGEMISELALAVRTSMFVGRLAQTVHPYPTWSSAIPMVATQFFSDAVTGRVARRLDR